MYTLSGFSRKSASNIEEYLPCDYKLICNPNTIFAHSILRWTQVLKWTFDTIAHSWDVVVQYFLLVRFPPTEIQCKNKSFELKCQCIPCWRVFLSPQYRADYSEDQLNTPIHITRTWDGRSVIHMPRVANVLQNLAQMNFSFDIRGKRYYM